MPTLASFSRASFSRASFSRTSFNGATSGTPHENTAEPHTEWRRVDPYRDARDAFESYWT